jgi:hypothetical protein
MDASLLLIVGFYIITYTFYSKATGGYSFALVLDFFLLRNGLKWSLKELNKVLALSGLTALLLLVYTRNENDLTNSLVLLISHAFLSFILIYNFQVSALFQQWWVKQISILAAIFSLICLGFLWMTPLGMTAAVILGFVHFWTMEVDRSFRLHVRPAGYLPFLLAAALLLIYFSFVARITQVSRK